MNPKVGYDVVVLGAGPAGSTAAAILARQSLSVLIVEQQIAISFKVGESVPGIMRNVLAHAGLAGVWHRVSQLRCSGNCSSWGSADLHARTGMLDPYGHGAHVDRVQFDQELLRESLAAGAQVWHGTRFEYAERSRRWTVFARSGAELRAIECDGVIDCTGRKAHFARSLGVGRITLDKQVAVASVFSGSENIVDNDLTTLIEATPEGWWYTAQIPNQRRVVVFFTDGRHLRQLQVRAAEGFVTAMHQTRYIREVLKHGYVNLGNPIVLRADTSYLVCSAGDGWCAAGDAAAALDPLASAGIVNAVRGGSAAARLVLDGFKDFRDYTRANVDRAKADAEMRRSYYLMEKRWPVAPFWVCRQRRADV